MRTYEIQTTGNESHVVRFYEDGVLQDKVRAQGRASAVAKGLKWVAGGRPVSDF